MAPGFTPAITAARRTSGYQLRKASPTLRSLFSNCSQAAHVYVIYMQKFGFTIHISTLHNLLGERLLRTMWVWGTRCLTTCQVAEFLVVFDVLQNTNPVQMIDLGRPCPAGPPFIPSFLHSFVQSGRFLRLELKVNEISIAFFPVSSFYREVSRVLSSYVRKGLCVLLFIVFSCLINEDLPTLFGRFAALRATRPGV